VKGRRAPDARVGPLHADAARAFAGNLVLVLEELGFDRDAVAAWKKEGAIWITRISESESR